MTNTDRYLAIVHWARRRYTQGNQIIISRGLVPSRYAIIEDLAAVKYLRANRHYPDALSGRQRIPVIQRRDANESSDTSVWQADA